MSGKLFPIFPKFDPLTHKEKEFIETFTKQFDPYSDFNFTSIWSYDTDNDVVFSWLNNNLVIRFRDYTTKQPFYSFLGKNNPEQTIEKLLQLSKTMGLKEELHMVPHISVEKILTTDKFNIQANEDHHDYIIPLKETISLSNINPHKQETYEKFLKNNPGYEVKNLNINDPLVQKAMINLFMLWKEQRNKSSQDVKGELLALKKLFTFSAHFSLFSLGIYIKDKLIGYIIDERIQKPYVMGHFIKADFSYPGTYEVLNKISAQMHFEKGFEYINIEQDLGIKGLRISKKQRNPVKYLKKYTITSK